MEAEITIQALTLDDGYVTDVLLYCAGDSGDEGHPRGGGMARRFSDRAPVSWIPLPGGRPPRRRALPCAAYPYQHNQGTSSDYDLPIFDKVVQYLKNDDRFDMGRIYTTGQSMGSVATIALAENRASQILEAPVSLNQDLTLTTALAPRTRLRACPASPVPSWRASPSWTTFTP